MCRSADRPFEHPAELPVKSPTVGATVRYITERLTAGQVMPALAEALAGGRRAARDELPRHRRHLDALARTGSDQAGGPVRARHPGAGQGVVRGARGFLVEALSRYLADRIKRDGCERRPTSRFAARFIVETCAFWAVHRHWDAQRQDLPEDGVRAAVIDLVVASLIAPAKTDTTDSRKGTKK